MTLLDAASQLLSAVVPVQCAGCGQWDIALCPDCSRALEGELQEVPRANGAGLLPVWALSTYQGPVRSMLVAWKNGKREDLTPAFVAAARRVAQLWAEQLSPAQYASIQASGSLLVLPAPSGWQRRLRGQMVTPLIADGVAAGVAEAFRARHYSSTAPAPHSSDPPPLAATSSVAPVNTPLASHNSKMSPRASPPFILSADILRRPLGSGPAHQSGRSSQGRRTARSRPPLVRANIRGMSVVLVDDVVTTGSTLGSCVRALDHAGASTLAALAIAAAPAPPSEIDTAALLTTPPRLVS